MHRSNTLEMQVVPVWLPQGSSIWEAYDAKQGERSGGKKVMAMGTTVQLNGSQTYCMATPSLGRVPKCELGHLTPKSKVRV